MPNGVGRTAYFNDGSDRVREPQFHHMEHAASSTYRNTSVLDNLMPSGNGYGSADKERLRMGIPKSTIGQSEENFGKSLWLRNERPAPLYRNSN